MKKIIKPGAKFFIMTCTRCGCEYSYDIEEIGKTSKLIVSNSGVQCPQCGNIDIHSKENATYPDYDYLKVY